MARSSHFPFYDHSRNKIEVESDLSYHATKSVLKNATSFATSQFPKTHDLANLKSEVDKSDIGKLETTLVDLSKLSNVAKNDVVKKIEYDELVKKVNVKNIINLATTAALNAKINEAKDKIHNITNLATTSALTTVENKIRDHSKYITNPTFNKLTAEHFTARLKQANLVTKDGITDFVKKRDFDNKLKNLNERVTSNKIKHVMVENEF